MLSFRYGVLLFRCRVFRLGRLVYGVLLFKYRVEVRSVIV